VLGLVHDGVRLDHHHDVELRPLASSGVSTTTGAADGRSSVQAMPSASSAATSVARAEGGVITPTMPLPSSSRTAATTGPASPASSSAVTTATS
jgi:hypothetical protein